MTIGTSLAISAILGIVAGCAGAAGDSKAARTDAPSPATIAADKHACGGHEGGSCGAIDAPDAGHR